MAEAFICRRGGGGDSTSTLPPPITSLYAKGGNQEMTVSFESVPEEYVQYLSNKAAYVVVVKKGSVPENPRDGDIIIKLDKTGAEL